jgi:hypothetical protein
MVKRLGIDHIQDAHLRRRAELLDRVAGDGDGAVDALEVASAIKSAKTHPDLKEHPELTAHLRELRDLVSARGENVPAPAGPGLSPMGVQLLALLEPELDSDGRMMLNDGVWETSCEHRFDVPKATRTFGDGQELLLPLDGRELHVIEVLMRDARRLSDQAFHYREAGSDDWQLFYGDDYFAMKKRESRGEVEIARDTRLGEPWVDNPMRVEVDIVMPDGSTFHVGDKRIEFHVKAMKNKNQRGYVELDVINDTTERLPDGDLPDGACLRLRVRYEKPQLWRDADEAAAEIHWVKPVYRPRHDEAKLVVDNADFSPIRPDGYAVDPDRPIAAVMVTWSDHISDAEGELTFATADGEFRSGLRWVSSGETELIATEGLRAKDGRLHVGGKKPEEIGIKRIEVLYADDAGGAGD